MIFLDALSAVFKDNDRITRTSWRNRDIYLQVVDGKLCTTWASESNRVDGQMHPLTVSESDYFGDDWEVVADA